MLFKTLAQPINYWQPHQSVPAAVCSIFQYVVSEYPFRQT